MRGALVTAEVSMALVLLVGAGLMVETFCHLLISNPGYNPKNLLTMQIALPEPFHTTCCTISSNRVNAAAATPVPIPVSSTANQKGQR
jgi:hypothetical protein